MLMVKKKNWMYKKTLDHAILMPHFSNFSNLFLQFNALQFIVWGEEHCYHTRLLFVHVWASISGIFLLLFFWQNFLVILYMQSILVGVIVKYWSLFCFYCWFFYCKRFCSSHMQRFSNLWCKCFLLDWIIAGGQFGFSDPWTLEGYWGSKLYTTKHENQSNLKDDDMQIRVLGGFRSTIFYRGYEFGKNLICFFILIYKIN